MAKVIGFVVALLTVVALAATAITVLMTVVVVFALYRGGRALQRRHREQVYQMTHQRAELLARADIQDRWYLAGDSRGVYGRFPPAA